MKRARKVRKYLRYYRTCHGFRAPFKVSSRSRPSPHSPPSQPSHGPTTPPHHDSCAPDAFRVLYSCHLAAVRETRRARGRMDACDLGEGRA